MKINIISLVITFTFLLISEVNAYVINQVVPSETESNSRTVYPTNITRLDMNEVNYHFDYLVKHLSFDELCVRIGGVILDNGDCHNEYKIEKYIGKTTKNIPNEYRDIYYHMNSYPKTFTNYAEICSELNNGTIDDMGSCVPKTAEPPRQISSTVIAITTSSAPAQLTISLPPITNTERIQMPTPTIDVEPTNGVEPTVEPEPTNDVEPTVEPEPTNDVEPTVEPEPTIEPDPTNVFEPTIEPDPTNVFEPTVEPGLTNGVVPTVDALDNNTIESTTGAIHTIADVPVNSIKPSNQMPNVSFQEVVSSKHLQWKYYQNPKP